MKIVYHNSTKEEPVSHDPRITKRVILRKGDADNVMQISQTSLLPHQATTPHKHEDMTEIYNIEEGAASFEIDGCSRRVDGPSTVVIHPGETHSISNESDQTLNFQYIGILSQLPLSNKQDLL